MGHIKGANNKAQGDKARINDEIKAREVRLIGKDGEQVGVVSLAEATRNAEEVTTSSSPTGAPVLLLFFWVELLTLLINIRFMAPKPTAITAKNNAMPPIKVALLDPC